MFKKRIVLDLSIPYYGGKIYNMLIGLLSSSFFLDSSFDDFFQNQDR